MAIAVEGILANLRNQLPKCGISLTSSGKTIMGYFYVPSQNFDRFSELLARIPDGCEEYSTPTVKGSFEYGNFVLTCSFRDPYFAGWWKVMTFLYPGYEPLAEDPESDPLAFQLKKAFPLANRTGVLDGDAFVEFVGTPDGRIDDDMLDVWRTLPEYTGLGSVNLERGSIGPRDDMRVAYRMAASVGDVEKLFEVGRQFEKGFRRVLKEAVRDAQADVAELRGMLKGRSA